MGRIIPNEETWIGFSLVHPGALPAPGAPTVTAATTGGSVASGSHSYRVAAIDDSGVTLPSSAGTVTNTGSTSVNTVTWSAVTGATGYKIYGRAAGSELLLATVGNVTSWDDNGSITPAGALPVVNSTANLGSPSVADVDACIDMTHFVASLNASAQGNAVPTPALDSLFETSILGTSQATFTADMYRDDENDVAWETLTRATKGYWYISRFGGKPDSAGRKLEVWPTTILSRAMANMANNTVESFTVTCAVPVEPAENAVVVA